MPAELDPDFQVLDKALGLLGEYFDSVQICVTRYEEDGTVVINRGTGNYYARIASTERFVKQAKSEDHAKILVKTLDDRNLE